MGLFSKKPMVVVRTAEQEKVIKYFTTPDGCFSGKMKDEKYDEMVLEKLKSFGAKNRALEMLGVDRDQVNEIEPIHFHGYVDGDDVFFCIGKDGRARTSRYCDTWLFFSDEQIFCYTITFDMTQTKQKDRTLEYFYKDITSFSTTIEYSSTTKASTGCFAKSKTNEVKFSKFFMTVPGDEFWCSTSSVADADQKIAAAKQKIREKKA